VSYVERIKRLVDNVQLSGAWVVLCRDNPLTTEQAEHIEVSVDELCSMAMTTACAADLTVDHDRPLMARHARTGGGVSEHRGCIIDGWYAEWHECQVCGRLDGCVGGRCAACLLQQHHAAAEMRRRVVEDEARRVNGD